MVVVREAPFLDLLDVLPDAADSDLGQVGETLGELGLEVGEHAEQIVTQQDLAVGAHTGPDTDRGYFELLGDQARDLAGHRLEFQHETAGVLYGQSVLQNRHRRLRRATLDPEAAEHGDGVRRQADVRGGRNAGIDQGFQDVRLALAALGLHGVAAGLLHEARGIHQRAVHRVVALVRHAAEHESVRRAATNGHGMQDHHLHGRGYGVGVAVRDHGQAVPDHGHVHARLLRPLGRGVVGYRHVDHFFAATLGIANLGNRALLFPFHLPHGPFSRNLFVIY